MKRRTKTLLVVGAVGAVLYLRSRQSALPPGPSQTETKRVMNPPVPLTPTITLDQFKAAFGSHGGPTAQNPMQVASPNWNPAADFNGDGVVDIVDYSYALAHLK